MRGWRFALAGVAGLVAAAAATVLAVALNAATGGTARWFPTMDRYPLWWTAGATVAVAGAGLLVWRVQGWYDRGLGELVPAVQRPEPWVVDRPDKVNQIVAALGRGGTVGVTTAVQGVGGFGKTTIAKIVGADRRVLRRFKGRVHWVTLGRDTGKEALAGLVNGLIARLEPDRPVTFTDARQAGEHLAAVLAKGPRRLLVLDDVWTPDQLAVFPVAGRCARLVTTRNPSLVPGDGMPVTVDQMSEKQARALLLAGLPPLPPGVAAGLMKETGRWPLLLRLVNGILTAQARMTPDLPAVAEDLLGQLRVSGVLRVDELTKDAGKRLDVADPDQRARAVRATIEASTGLLGPDEHDRLAELAVFAEDETIPVPLITALWRATSGLDPIAARALCARMADLALLTTVPGGTVTMHDVIRDYLREKTGAARLAQLNGMLLDAAAKEIPAAGTLDAGAPEAVVTAWWELGTGDRYLWDHLVEHLLQAGRLSGAETVATDLRWAGARLEESGPAALAADLSLVGTPRTVRLRGALEHAAHLLAPADPPGAVVDVLHSRVASDPDWGPQVAALRNLGRQPRLVNRWPLPDLPDPALRRSLTGHDSMVSKVVIAPDGSWLATSGYDGKVRICDPDTGQERAVLSGPEGSVTALAIAPDGNWLAAGDVLGTVRIWDTATFQQRAPLVGHSSWVTALAVAPDGSWLAVGSSDGKVRICDVATGKQRVTLADSHHGDTDKIEVAVAPDGSWLAVSGEDGKVRICDVATGKLRAALAGPPVWATAVAVAPDGSWLVTGGGDGTVRIWDPATGRERGALAGHDGAVNAVAVAPDGSWLVTGGGDGTVRIWDPAKGQRATLASGKAVTTVAVAPDGSWVASGGEDGTVRIWDPAIDREQAALTARSREVRAVAAAPDASWVATGGKDGTIRICDAATGQEQAVLTGHDGAVNAVEVAPDGSWLATGGEDGTIRIWDRAAGHEQAVIPRYKYATVHAVAAAPDGSWLAAGVTGEVWIWDTATRKQQATFTSRKSAAIRAVAVAPDGGWLAAGRRDGRALIWDTATKKQLGVLTRGKVVNAVAIAPDGSSLPAGTRHFLVDGAASIWNWITRDPAARMQRNAPRSEAVNALAIAADGSWLATGSRVLVEDNAVRIWDAATLRQRAVLVGHKSTVNAMAVAPDGNWLAVGSQDGTVRIWHVATWKQQTLMRVESTISSCAWLGSGGLAVGGTAGLYVFDFLTGTAPTPDIEHG